MKVNVKFLSQDSKEICKQLKGYDPTGGFTPIAAVYVSFLDQDNLYTGILFIGYLNGYIPYTIIRSNVGNLPYSEHLVSPLILMVQRMVLNMVG